MPFLRVASHFTIGESPNAVVTLQRDCDSHFVAPSTSFESPSRWKAMEHDVDSVPRKTWCGAAPGARRSRRYHLLGCWSSDERLHGESQHRQRVICEYTRRQFPIRTCSGHQSAWEREDASSVESPREGLILQVLNID